MLSSIFIESGKLNSEQKDSNIDISRFGTGI